MKLHLVASFILIALVIIYILINSRQMREGFDNNNGLYPGFCGDCNSRGKKGMNACLSCNNCGWCTDPNGYGSCVLGDQNGPYFAECANYMFNGGMSVPYPARMRALGGNGNGNGNSNDGAYQLLYTPYFGGTGPGYMNPAPNYIGNTYYNTSSPLKSARRWRPTGDSRLML